MSAPLSSIALGELTFLLAREVGDAARDCERIQQAVGALLDDRKLDDETLMAVQDLDRITQVLHDVAAVLTTMNPYVEGDGLPPENLLEAVRMDSLLSRITNGPAPDHAKGDLSLF